MRQKILRILLPALCCGVILCSDAATLAQSNHAATQLAAALRRQAPGLARLTRAERDYFPIAVWFAGGKSRAPMLSRHPRRERAEWLRQLETIKRLGFNSVKTWVDWSTAEPRPGVFDMRDLRQLLELAQQAGLKVIVQVYADSAPDWVGEKFPHAEFVTATGVHIRSQSAPGYSFDNPGVHAAELDFYRHVAQVAAASPAFYGYDLWSEPHLVNWVWFNDLPHVQFDFNRFTIARFQQWLRRKYGTLAALNHAWYRGFENWNEVQPPRFGTILSYSDFMDWRAFILHKLAADLGAKAGAVMAVSPKFITSSHSDIPGVLNTPLDGYGNPDDWLMFRRVDYYGASIYPLHAEAQLHGWPPEERAFGFDGSYAASMGRGFFVGEMQAGQGATGLRVNDPVTGAELQEWGWTAIAHGAKSIAYYAWYPMNAGYESDGYGMIHLDGTLTRRAHAAGALAAAVNAHARLFHDAQPVRAQLALLYNPLSYLSGGDTVSPGQAVRNSLMGVYRAFYAENLPVTFLHAGDVARHAAEYKAIYLPYDITLARPVARALAAYVRQGGTLIAEARTAWNDARGFAYPRIPGGGLDRVFGVQEASLWPGTKTTFTFLPSAPAGMAGLTSPAAQFEEALKVERGTVLARFADGRPAVVESHYGRGKTIYIGTFLGIANQTTHTADTGKLLRALGRWAGIAPPLTVYGGSTTKLEVRLLDVPWRAMPPGEQTHAGQLLIAINHGPAGHYQIRLKRRWTGVEKFFGASQPKMQPAAGGNSLSIALAHQGVTVLLLH